MANDLPAARPAPRATVGDQIVANGDPTILQIFDSKLTPSRVYIFHAAPVIPGVGLDYRLADWFFPSEFRKVG